MYGVQQLLRRCHLNAILRPIEGDAVTRECL